MAKATHIAGKTILAMTDGQVFKINQLTNRKMHPTPAPKKFLPGDKDDNGNRANEWSLRGSALIKYADYYALFLLGQRAFPGQPSKFKLTSKQADKVRDEVRGRLFDALNVNSVVPLNADDVDAIIAKKAKEWDVFADAS